MARRLPRTASRESVSSRATSEVGLPVCSRHMTTSYVRLGESAAAGTPLVYPKTVCRSVWRNHAGLPTPTTRSSRHRQRLGDALIGGLGGWVRKFVENV